MIIHAVLTMIHMKTICGKRTNLFTAVTTNPKKVTCPECLKILEGIG